MPSTYTLISSVTVGSGGAANIAFTSIPATYTDLCIKFSGRGTTALSATSWFMRLNSSGTGYSSKRLYGSGTAAASDSSTSGGIYLVISTMSASTGTANTFGNAEIYIPNYAGSSNKSASIDDVQENNTTQAYAELAASLWSNTAAVTSLSIFPDTGNLAQYSTAYLYGISNA
jgi:hypothetical protein